MLIYQILQVEDFDVLEMQDEIEQYQSLKVSLKIDDRSIIIIHVNLC